MNFGPLTKKLQARMLTHPIGLARFAYNNALEFGPCDFATWKIFKFFKFLFLIGLTAPGGLTLGIVPKFLVSPLESDSLRSGLMFCCRCFIFLFTQNISPLRKLSLPGGLTRNCIAELRRPIGAKFCMVVSIGRIL